MNAQVYRLVEEEKNNSEEGGGENGRTRMNFIGDEVDIQKGRVDRRERRVLG